MMLRILKAVFLNPWMKTLYFLIICFGATGFIVMNFETLFREVFNWRSKYFWSAVAFIVPTFFLLPTFLNIMLFAKIVQIADNTNKTNKIILEYLKKQNLN